MGHLLKSLLAIVFLVSVSVGELTEDLRSIGVPALSAEFLDSTIVVSLSGSLAQGDSLLKHYGGVFFTVVDSIIGGWDICGISVELEEAVLIFRRCDMVILLDKLAVVTEDEIIADWILNHTRVIRNPN